MAVASRSGSIVREEPVGPQEQLRRRLAVRGEGVQDRPQLRHDRGRGEVVTLHVAEEQHDAAVLAGHDVVEVAADLAGPHRGAVAGAEHDNRARRAAGAAAGHAATPPPRSGPAPAPPPVRGLADERGDRVHVLQAGLVERADREVHAQAADHPVLVVERDGQRQLGADTLHPPQGGGVEPATSSRVEICT
jgi:hypothetical protein